jgi:hypothetical protein
MVAVLRAMRSGSIPALDGCGVIVTLESGLSESEMQTDLVAFLAIYGEVEDYPRGTVRHHWSPDALAQKDADWREYESRMRDRIITLAAQAEESLRNELKTT